MDENNEYENINSKLDAIMNYLGIEDLDSNPQTQDVYYIDKLSDIKTQLEEYLQTTNDMVYLNILHSELEEVNSIKERIDKLQELVSANHNLYLKKQNDKNVQEIKIPVEDKLIKVAPPPVNENKINRKLKKQEIEYKIGGELFGVIGAVMILIALITLGKFLLPRVLQGFALYLIPVVFMGFYTYIKNRKLQKFADIMLSIGVASAYIITLINYFYMHNFGALIALLISLAITVSTWFLSKKTNNTVIKLISMIGFYLSLIPGYSLKTIGDFIVLPVCLLLIAGLDLFIKTKYDKVYSYVSLVLTLISGISLFFMSVFSENLIRFKPVVASIVIGIMSLIVVSTDILSIINTLKHKDKIDKNYKLVSTILISIQFFLMGVSCNNFDYGIPFVMMLVVLAANLLLKANDKNYNIAYLFGFAPILLLAITFDNHSINTFGETALIVCSMAFQAFISYITFKDSNKSFKISSILVLLGISFCYNHYSPWILAFGIGFSLILLLSLKIQYAELSVVFVPVIATLIFCLLDEIKISYRVKVSIELIALDLLTLATIYGAKFAEDKPKKISTISSLVWNGVAIASYLCFYNEYGFLNWGVSTLCSLSIIMMLTPDSIGSKDFYNHRPFILSGICIAYVFLIPKAPNFLISIILLAIAAGDIFYGIMTRIKNIRIVGLVLSLLMTCKLFLVDIVTHNTLSKVFLFLLCGAIILSISFIYNNLEKQLSSGTKK